MPVIGAPGHDSSGGAYAFTQTSGGWTQTAELTASDASGDNFGGVVATSGTTTAAGPPGTARVPTYGRRERAEASPGPFR
jgi:hypothetical protein